jgi:pilus assembly protein CpaC
MTRWLIVASAASVGALAGMGSAMAVPFGYGEFLLRSGSTQVGVTKDRGAGLTLAQATPNAENSGASVPNNSRTAATRPAPAAQSIELYPGEVKVLAIPNVERVAIGNGSLMTATIVDDKQIVLLGESEGRTSMHLWLKGGRQQRFEVKVAGINQAEKAANELRAILGVDASVRVNVVNDKVVLSGDYASNEHAGKVRLLAAQYPQVINLVNERPLGFEVPKQRMVLMDVKVIEARKAAVDNLGIKWSLDQIQGPQISNNFLFYSNSQRRPDLSAQAGGLGNATPARPLLSFVGMANQITSMLNFLERNGDSWTLAEPRVSTVSGGKSKVQVGGEVPIPVATGFGQVSVVYKNYGVILEIEPEVDVNGNIRSKIVTEVSRPDPSTGAGGFTGFITNRTDTEVNMVEGETLVISGLLLNNGGTNQEGVQGLQHVPVLGRLFSNREFINDRTEMLVIVTPRIHVPGSTTAKAMENSAQEKIDHIESVIEKRVSD